MACKLLCLLVVFAIITYVAHGGPGCGVENIALKQSKNGTDKGKPVWKVTLSNPCRCPITQIKMSCPGFETVVPVDSLTKTGDVCFLSKGVLGDYVFRYVWDTSFEFKVIDGKINFTTCA